LFPVVAPQLRQGYYSDTCPNAEMIVRGEMQKAMIKDPRSGASVMRFQFHDCFVNGCDASLLLDDTPTMLGEKLSLSNIDSLRSYEVIDKIKEALEGICPMTVSCADIIIMASRDAVAVVFISVSILYTYISFWIYNQSDDGKPDPSIEPGFLKKLQELCPLGGDENVIGDLDFTPKTFDNEYFKDLVNGKGFLNSDQTLFTNPQTREYVQRYSEDQSAFLKDFVEGMIKLGDLQSGRPGEIRKNCRVVNCKKNCDKL
ncbi:peroxidase 17, partial [Tanacetum coccineum]